MKTGDRAWSELVDEAIPYLMRILSDKDYERMREVRTPVQIGPDPEGPP